MCSHDGATDVDHQALELVRGQGALPRQASVEALAFEHLHDEKGHALVDPVVEHLDDVRAAQRRGGLRLALEPRGDVGVFRNGLVDQLDRDGRAQREVERTPDRAHAACVELSDDAILFGDDFADHGDLGAIRDRWAGAAKRARARARADASGASRYTRPGGGAYLRGLRSRMEP